MKILSTPLREFSKASIHAFGINLNAIKNFQPLLGNSLKLHHIVFLFLLLDIYAFNPS